MIEIKVNGVVLAVPPNLSITREFESTIFNRDAQSVDFTYPIDIPLTDEAIQALGLPHIVANPGLKKTYDAELVIDGLFISAVKLNLVKTSLKNKTCSISIIGSYGSFAQLIGSKKVNELYLDGVRIVGEVDYDNEASLTIEHSIFWYAPCTTAQHMKAVAEGSVVTDYLFYMAVDEKPNLPYIHDTTEFFNVATSDKPNRSILNHWYYNDSDDYGFSDPIKMYLESTWEAMTQANTNDRWFWVPFFRIVYVLRKCFEELGYTVTGDILSDTEFAKKTLYNTYAINSVIVQESILGGESYEGRIIHNAVLIDPRNHVPKMTIVDFLTETGKAFNFQYLINTSTGIVEIRQLANPVPTAGNTIDLTGRAFPKPDIVFEDADFTKGYEFSFVADEADEASLENATEDLSGYHMRGSFTSYLDLQNVTAPAAGDIAYVINENAYYQYRGTFLLIDWWTFHSQNVGSYKTKEEDNLQKLECKALPVSMKLHEDIATRLYPSGPLAPLYGSASYMQHMLLPYSRIGIEGRDLFAFAPVKKFIDEEEDVNNFLGSLKTVSYTLPKPIQPHLCNYLGIYKTQYDGTLAIPYGSNNSHDGEGIDRGGKGLYWYDPTWNGLYHHYWRGLIETLARAVKVEHDVLLDVVTYRRADLNQVFIKIDALYYLCQKAQLQFPFPSVSNMTLVRM